MLTQVANGVLVHQSAFLQTNTVVVQGPSGVLLVDPGVTADELTCLASDLRQLGQPVVAGFSTHPHWDHLLWHAELGAPPRFSTHRSAATARARLSDPGAAARVASALPHDIADQVPLDLLGLITGLPADADVLPWDGPRIEVIEHQAHAPGHAALLIEDSGVLVAGDMLSDLLIPMLDLSGTADPVADYLAALDLLQAISVDVVIPGHGGVGDAGQLSARLDLDRVYVEALGDGGGLDDPRLAAAEKAWLIGVHERQRQHLHA